jgi:hypothetical protein
MREHMQEIIGKVIEEFPISFESEQGSIAVGVRGIAISIGARIAVPYNYVESLSEGKKLALGKTGAAITLYDMLGNRRSIEFVISGVGFAVLKKACGK